VGLGKLVPIDQRTTDQAIGDHEQE
jgi:hypothetical protein